MAGRAAVFLALASLPVLLGCAAAEADREIVVFAAASLTDVTEAFATAFEREHPGVRVVVSLGASSTLARQIDAGAPADVFLSASPEWTAYVQTRDRLAGRPVVLARNRLIVLGPPETSRLDASAELLALGRVAVADPAHVPAGRYAQEVLTADGLWDSLSGRLVPTLDVRAAVAAVQTGAADAALAYASDTLAAPRLRVRYIWPDARQPDIAIVGALVQDGSLAAAFLAYLYAPEQAGQWRRYGFQPIPTEGAP